MLTAGFSESRSYRAVLARPVKFRGSAAAGACSELWKIFIVDPDYRRTAHGWRRPIWLYPSCRQRPHAARDSDSSTTGRALRHLNPEATTHMRGQRRDAGGVCPPVLLGSWRTRRAASAIDERFHVVRAHLEPRRRPCGLLAATALMYLDAAITRRAAQGQLIQHSVRGALQLIRLPHGGNGSGELRKRRLADRESDDGMLRRQVARDPL